MANIYVRSTDGNNADNGTTWALAKATLAGAAAIDVEGDTFFVSDAHAESTAAAVSIALAGSAAFPIRILCADDVAEPPTALATTGTVATTGASNITITGHGYIYGLTFTAGNSTNAASFFLATAANDSQRFDKCKLFLGGSSSANRINVSGSSASPPQITWKDVDVKFANAGQSIALSQARFIWEGGSIAAGGTSPTVFLLGNGAARSASKTLISGLDLSNAAAGMHLFGGNGFDAIIRNCKLPASWTGTIFNGVPAAGTRVEMHNCDSGDTNYRIWVEDYTGELREETTIVRTGGASDGTTALSWKVSTSTSVNPTTARFETPEIAHWNDTVGTSITVALDILHDSLTNLKNDEAWLEVQYLGTSGSSQSSFVSDAKADVLATAADQDASSAAWTTTGLTNPNKQKLSVTFTPQEKGFLHIRACFGKYLTAYVDFKPQVS